MCAPVGVAGGATRTALTLHFAKRGNAADIAAKEGSQETATTLVRTDVAQMWMRRLLRPIIWMPWSSRGVPLVQQFMIQDATHKLHSHTTHTSMCGCV